MTSETDEQVIEGEKKMHWTQSSGSFFFFFGIFFALWKVLTHGAKNESM